ncbi:MAG TPA: NAD(+)/NADH kinase [Acidimicrobiales bacterium]|nr:NAD(+)/NADH kinase [Acidimicrobiales bacterium]
MPAPIGVVANPASGRDVRRLLAAAGTSTPEEKASIVRRVLLGAADVGARRFVFLPESAGIVRRATDTLAPEIEREVLSFERHLDERDSTRAAELLRDAGCAVVVVLGGDGTNRAVAKGWPDAPLLPLSTGTNNAFPEFVEATVAGVAAGLVSTGRVRLDEVAERAKVVVVEIDGEAPDLALVDLVATTDPWVGSMELFDPERLVAAVLTRAEPASVGFSAVGGLLHPTRPADERGLVVWFAPPDVAPRRLRAPTAPGHHAELGIASVDPLGLGDEVRIAGPCVLAFDGERRRAVPDGAHARVRVERTGPWVIRPTLALELAAARGTFLA